MASLSVGGTPMALSSAGEALPSVYTTRPGEAVPLWLCAELAQLDRASVYETEGRRFDSCIPRHPRFSHRFLSPSSVCGKKCPDLNSVLPPVRSSGRLSGKKAWKTTSGFFLAILLGLTAFVLPPMAFYYRCRACGSLAHGFKSYTLANFETGEAFFVCRRCGDRTVKGKVESDGSGA